MLLVQTIGYWEDDRKRQNIKMLSPNLLLSLMDEAWWLIMKSDQTLLSDEIRFDYRVCIFY